MWKYSYFFPRVGLGMGWHLSSIYEALFYEDSIHKVLFLLDFAKMVFPEHRVPRVVMHPKVQNECARLRSNNKQMFALGS